MDSKTSNPTPPSSLLTAMLKDDMAPKQKPSRYSVYPPTPPSTMQSQSDNSLWTKYPPVMVPRYDLPDPYIPPTEGLRSAEELVDSYASQLGELDGRIKGAKEARKSLRTDSEARQQLELHSFLQQTYTDTTWNLQTRMEAWEKALALQAELEPERQTILEQDRVLVGKILLEYNAFTSLRSYEAEASEAQRLTSLRAEETRNRAKKLTKVEHNIKRMFGFRLDRLRSQEPTLSPQTNQPQSPPIPDWFYVLRSKFHQLLPHGDVAVGFQALLKTIDKLQKEAECWKQQGGPKSWDKVWHKPNKQWPHEFQRLKGGWWKCRSGPEAPDAERWCSVCHKTQNTAQQPDQPNQKNPQEKLDTIMGFIRVAMEDVAKMDQEVVKQRFQEEQKRESDSRKMHNEVSLRHPVEDPAGGPENSVNYSLFHGLEDTLR
ncbi:hypothetical protein Hte_005500 [Hypoxylon texense]